VIIIARKKEPNWPALHDEYIAGGISQRKLAAKYGIDYGKIRDKSIRDGWVKDRDRAMSKAQAKVEQKIAEAAADNATIAARIRSKLLRKLEKEIDAIPDLIGSETRNTLLENEYLTNDKGKPIGNKPARAKEVSKSFKIRDLTAAFKDLTADMVTTETAGNELLQSLMDLERRCHGD
jgi:hypothetical protein